MNAPLYESQRLNSFPVAAPDIFRVVGPVTADDAIFLDAPSLEHVSDFMMRIEALRASMPFPAWRALCMAQASPWSGWIAFLCEDPFTRHGLTKPRGYPGDAGLMDFAYGHPAIRDAVGTSSDLGQALYALLYEAGMSRSARVRTDLVAELLGAEIARHGAMAVTSFAAGHARELEKISDAHAAQIVQFTSIDTDPVSQAEVERSQAGRIPVRSLRKSVLRVRTQEVGEAEFVYSMGLFDYLERPFAERVIRTMATMVKPGGALLVGNLCREPVNIAYCEAVLDWWMVLRDESEMVALGAVVTALGGDWSYEVVRRGCFYYVLARRAG